MSLGAAASQRLTWSVQVGLLEGVLEGSVAEQHGTGTYPQVQGPGHRRDHRHALEGTADREGQPQLPGPSPLSSTEESRGSGAHAPLLLENKAPEVMPPAGPKKSTLQKIMHSFVKFSKTTLQELPKDKNKLKFAYG